MRPQTQADPQGPISLESLPMAQDRTLPYAMLRDAGPVVRLKNGGFVVTSREAADYVLRNPEIFSSERAFATLGSPVPLLPIASDPPGHTRYRRILQPFFTPRTAALLERSSHGQVNGLIDRIAGRDSCEVVAELARPFPAQVFLTLFGLPPEDLDRLLGWKDAIVGSADLSGSAAPPPEVMESAAQLFAYTTAHVAACRAGTGGGLLADVLAATRDDPLTDTEALGLCFLFIIAGIDSVTSALSLMFAKLAADPALQARIVADPSVIPQVVEEMLRIDPANCTLPRVATTDVELHGHLIPAGSSVGVALGAANRDPAELDDPDAFDVGRKYNHLTFGGGPHRCVGIHLARMEFTMVLREWHRRIPSYGLAPGFQPLVGWPAGVIGLSEVPLVFPARR
ncbi:cytochrome P450 [Microbispora sp. NPDC049125]|uniref:cytochrome P450 n=1 Tax=Microbispora sp. NPDC049125 TaxID=3154929 RepID=UPI0034668988